VLRDEHELHVASLAKKAADFFGIPAQLAVDLAPELLDLQIDLLPMAGERVSLVETELLYHLRRTLS
jgi:hypothetical protein